VATHPNHIDLPEIALNNDADLFTYLFRRYGGRILNYYMRYVKRQEPAEDLLQDLFIKIWNHRGNLLEEKNIEGYLFISARNHLYNHLNKKLNAESITLTEDEVPVASEQVDGYLIYKETEAVYKAALATLTEKRRRAFLLNREQGLSYREIALQMNISPRTVEKHISEALQLLRQRIPSHYLPFILFIIW